MNDTTQTPTLTIPKEIYLTLMEALDELEDAYRPDAQSVNARLWLQTYASQRTGPPTVPVVDNKAQ